MPKKALIIDDSPMVLAMLKDLVADEGCEVVLAKTGEEGIQKARSEAPDLVIIDTVMPGMDGFEACRKIKEEAAAGKTKVIMITGSVDAIDAVKARRMGADDYVVKTSGFTVLREAIKKILK